MNSITQSLNDSILILSDDGAAKPRLTSGGEAESRYEITFEQKNLGRRTLIGLFQLSKLSTTVDILKQTGQTGLDRPSGPPHMSRSLLLVDVVSSLSDDMRTHSITRV